MKNRYIIGNSSSGKTRQLLEAAQELGAVFVCQNPEAMRVKVYFVLTSVDMIA